MRKLSIGRSLLYFLEEIEKPVRGVCGIEVAVFAVEFGNVVAEN